MTSEQIAPKTGLIRWLMKLNFDEWCKVVDLGVKIVGIFGVGFTVWSSYSGLQQTIKNQGELAKERDQLAQERADERENAAKEREKQAEDRAVEWYHTKMHERRSQITDRRVALYSDCFSSGMRIAAAPKNSPANELFAELNKLIDLGSHIMLLADGEVGHTFGEFVGASQRWITPQVEANVTKIGPCPEDIIKRWKKFTEACRKSVGADIPPEPMAPPAPKDF